MVIMGLLFLIVRRIEFKIIRTLDKIEKKGFWELLKASAQNSKPFSLQDNPIEYGLFHLQALLPKLLTNEADTFGDNPCRESSVSPSLQKSSVDVKKP